MSDQSRSAVILGSSVPTEVQELARPLAGAPLLVRQLEWLRANGVTSAIVNRVSTEPLPASLSADVLATTGVQVTWVASIAPLSAADLVAKMGPAAAAACVLPHAWLTNTDVIGAMALVKDTGDDVKVWCGDASLDVLSVPRTPSRREPRAVATPGWLTEIREEEKAHLFTESLLAGRIHGVAIRGTQTSRGVYRARGSVVAPGATVTGPCYLGADSYVAAGARLGPGTVLDEGAVIEKGAELAHVRVASKVVIGQGIRIQRACVYEGRIERHEGRVVQLDDDLLIGRNNAGRVVVDVVRAVYARTDSLWARLSSAGARRAASRE